MVKGGFDLGVGLGVSNYAGLGVDAGLGLGITAVTAQSILQKLPSFLSLDISKNSTGYVVWYENGLEVGTITLKSPDPSECRREFSSNLIELIGGRSFSYVLVEDTIGGCNYKTNRILSQLNVVVDTLMEYDKIPTMPILREGNSEWKKKLRLLTSELGAEVSRLNDKEEICARLSSLGLDITGIKQDILDAYGMALSVLYFELFGSPKGVSSKYSPSSFKIKCFPTSDKAMEFAEKKAKSLSCMIKCLGSKEIKHDLKRYISTSCKEQSMSEVTVVSVPECRLGVYCYTLDYELVDGLTFTVIYRWK